MHYCPTFIAKLFRRMPVVLLMSLLIGCNNFVVPSSSHSSTNSKSLFNANNLLLPNAYQDFNIPHILHIQGGFECTPQPKGGDNALVLATNRLRYDSHEIQQMSAYLDKPFNTLLPNTLQFVSGGFLTPSSFDDLVGCGGVWELSNIGNMPIQISDLAIRLTEDSRPNSYHYNLINVCSIGAQRDLNNPYSCQPIGGSEGDFVYSFQLRPGKANTIFHGKATSTYSSSTPSIEPGGTVSLLMDVESPVSNGSQVYTVVPVLTLNTVGRASIYELKQLTARLAFAKDIQFSCYKLREDTFIPQQVQVKSAPSSRCL